jgi:hypothetical protein
MIKGSKSLPNGSGFKRPKNIRIRHIGRYQSIRYVSLGTYKNRHVENRQAFICPPASVTNSFQDNPARVTIKFGRGEKNSALW